jgi:hypothetical protein
MKAKIYVQVKDVPRPVFVILDENRQKTTSEYILIEGPSECVYDEELGKFIVLTESTLRLTRDP